MRYDFVFEFFQKYYIYILIYKYLDLIIIKIMFIYGINNINMLKIIYIYIKKTLFFSLINKKNYLCKRKNRQLFLQKTERIVGTVVPFF